MISRRKLTQLCEDCARLLFYSEKLDSDANSDVMENNKIIRQSLRKIIIANEISDRMIICITGLQGTGKTTLMKNFYDLDDDVMNITTGRGERLPILITESDVKKPKMYAIGIEKCENGYERVKKEITQSDFVNLSKAEDDSTIMYLEMLVPWKYVNKTGKVSYMLLPGYENSNNYWDALIEFSVQCSDTAVFVMTPDRVASADNAELIERINRRFGENVIYAISHSDEKSDDNIEIKKTLMKLVGAKIDDTKKFVCTGAYIEKEKNEKWKEELREAIEIYCSDSRTADIKNSKYIEKLIAEELRPPVASIKRYFSDASSDILVEFTHSTWLTSFDKAAQKMRKQFERKLSTEFERSKGDDIARMHKKLEGEDAFKKVGNALSHVRKSIFGESLSDIEKAKNIIIESMQEEGIYRYQRAFVNSIAKCTDQLCISKENEETVTLEKKDVKPTLISKKDEKEKILILKDVSTILSKENRKNELEANPNETMQVMVECATQFFGLNIMNEIYHSNFKAPELTESNLSAKEVMSSIKDTEKFAMTVLGVTGLDLIGDGVLNFIPALAGALGISVPVAGAIVSTIIASGTAISIIKDYNKVQIKDYYSYGKAISYVYDDIKCKYLDVYDEYIAAVRDRVEDYLIDCVGVNDDVVNRQNAIISIKNVSDDIDSIRKELKDESYDPTKLIKG